jgi:hypothetical protein
MGWQPAFVSTHEVNMLKLPCDLDSAVTSVFVFLSVTCVIVGGLLVLWTVVPWLYMVLP